MVLHLPLNFVSLFLIFSCTVVTSVEVVPTEPTAVTDSIAVTSKGTFYNVNTRKIINEISTNDNRHYSEN